MKQIPTLVLVALGGALGATARYAAGTILPSLTSTVMVNIVGCFAIGYVLHAARFDAVSEQERVFVATGFLSSFTTYSAFTLDAFTSRPSVAVVYIAVSYSLGFTAVAAGSSAATHREATP